MKKNVSNSNPSQSNNIKADIKKESYVDYSLPVEPQNLEVLRRLTKQSPWSTPRDIFYFMLGKDICSDEMLKEMFALDDTFLPLVFDEIRDVYRGDNVLWILEHDLRTDENGEYVSITLSPAQQKLRKLLWKIVFVDRFNYLRNELEDGYEEYGIDLEDEYCEIAEENTITEEELLDALQTYQNEHRA